MDTSSKVKNKIQYLIEENDLENAKYLLDEYRKIGYHDFEYHNFRGIISMIDNDYELAIQNFKIGLLYNDSSFDLNYNLAFAYEGIKEHSKAHWHYNKCTELECSLETKIELENKLRALENEREIKYYNYDKKIVFFVKKGMDSFLGDIVDNVSRHYNALKIIVTEYNQIDLAMKWADICWFEWCDELVVYGSKLDISRKKYILCRLHRYEVFTDYPKKVFWENVDKLMIVTEHLKKFLNDIMPRINNMVEIVTINNGVNLDKFSFKERTIGFNIAYVGYIHQRKNPVLLLQIIKKLTNIDKRYKLYIAGRFQDPLIEEYWYYQINEMKLHDNVVFDGWQSNMDIWLEDKNYVLSTSIHESFGYGIAEAMSRGIKPVIHNFLFATDIWSRNYLFNTIEEAVSLITKNDYNSKEYRQFIEKNYSLDNQIINIYKMIDDLFVLNKDKTKFNYKEYWNSRLETKFDIEGVGYLGLGEIYNKFLYKNRLELLDVVFKMVFKNKNKPKVLELGPGIGIFTKYFFDNNIEVYTGIDISEKSAVILKEKYNMFNFINGDISNRDNYKEKFDFIFAADVLLHLTDEDKYIETINNLADSLEDEGVILLFEPISLINSKSESPHVVIRDYNYVNKVLIDRNLEIVNIIPVSFFMNYPFDRDIIEYKSDLILNIFNSITQIYMNNYYERQEKEILGEILLNKDRNLIHQHKLGLSQKMLIIKKASNYKLIEQSKDLFECSDLSEYVEIKKINYIDKLNNHPEILDLLKKIDSLG